MPAYTIREVKTGRDLDKFVKFPDELYKDCPQWVPAIYSEEKKSLTKCHTASYCPHKMWLAMDEQGKVVGRICGMVNPRYNELYDKKRARFGWFDTINDIQVAELLLATAEKWAKEQGMEEIHGPLYYNTMGKQGMLVEGFGNIPPFNCLYNFPYYNDLVEKLGFEGECDWVQYKMDAQQEVEPKIKRIAELLKERYHLHEGSIDAMKKDKALIAKFFKVYNESFSKAVYNFVPFDDEEIQEEVKSVFSMISDKSSAIVLDENDELVAFAITFPSMSFALQEMKGRIWPFGWRHVLHAMNDYRVIDLMLNGAVPQWQNKGVSSIYHCSMSDRYRKLGTQWVISNPQIDTNSASKTWGAHYSNELFMRRRCYIKKIK